MHSNPSPLWFSSDMAKKIPDISGSYFSIMFMIIFNLGLMGTGPCLGSKESCTLEIIWKILVIMYFLVVLGRGILVVTIL